MGASELQSHKWQVMLCVTELLASACSNDLTSLRNHLELQ